MKSLRSGADVRDYWGGRCELVKDFWIDGVAEVNPVPLEVTEQDHKGSGTVTFNGARNVLFITGQSINTPWLKSGQNADGLFLDYQSGSIRLHLVELKSKLTLAKFEKAITQLQWSFVKVRAVISTLGVSKIDNHICYIAYSDDCIASQLLSNPVAYKSALGSKARGALISYHKNEVILPYGNVARLEKIQRDAHGNAAVTI